MKYHINNILIFIALILYTVSLPITFLPGIFYKPLVPANVYSYLNKLTDLNALRFIKTYDKQKVKDYIYSVMEKDKKRGIKSNYLQNLVTYWNKLYTDKILLN